MAIHALIIFFCVLLAFILERPGVAILSRIVSHSFLIFSPLFYRECLPCLRERQMVAALPLFLGRQEWSSSPYILERRGMASHALMFLFDALLSFLLEKPVVATPSLLPRRQGVAILTRSIFIRVLSLVLSYFSRGALPPSREARDDHHLSCYSLLFSPLRASRDVVSFVFLPLAPLQQEGREDGREENIMRGCPPSPPSPPASLEEDEETARGQDKRREKKSREMRTICWGGIGLLCLREKAVREMLGRDWSAKLATLAWANVLEKLGRRGEG